MFCFVLADYLVKFFLFVYYHPNLTQLYLIETFINVIVLTTKERQKIVYTW